MIRFKYYECPNCGFGTYAMDKLLRVTCRKCGTLVETKPVPEVKKSNLGLKEGLKVPRVRKDYIHIINERW